MKAVSTAATINFASVHDIDGIASKIILYRDNDLLTLIAPTKHYQDFIKDPFKAYLLTTKVVQTESDKVFFENLDKASDREYKSESEVLNTFRDIEVGYSLLEFQPYQTYISKPERALSLFKAIQTNPKLPGSFGFM